ncbi:hypothetical protein GCM10010416_52660 [Streptomyces caniferus]
MVLAAEVGDWVAWAEVEGDEASAPLPWQAVSPSAATVITMAAAALRAWRRVVCDMYFPFCPVIRVRENKTVGRC